MEIIKTVQVVEEDIDLLNHMNYRKYIEQLEDARMEWFEKIGMAFPKMLEMDISAVLLKMEIQYLKEARLGDNLTIKTKPLKLGTKSFSLKQMIYNETNEKMTESICTLVMFDMVSRRSIPVAEKIAKQFKGLKMDSIT